MLQCYNRGCGQKFNPENNKDDSCRHHPGEPYFHDAYKGWSCCNKKSVDFTEFLNMKGCTLSKHSNVKPPEPKKPEKQKELYEEPVVEVRQPIKVEMKRPPFDSPMTIIEPTVMPALKDAIDSLEPNLKEKKAETNSGEIAIGTICKNGGCNATYSSPESDETECQYHPGVPIFHEGMKFWSCCTRKTTDFTTFMNQPGCSYGKHKWIGDNDDKKVINCRYDWHQTPSNVIVAIYAKMYHYAKSTIKVNPIRLAVRLIFPNQDDAEFNLDLELRGIIKVDSTNVKMYPTKIEITMAKAEASSWLELDFPRNIKPVESSDNIETKDTKSKPESKSDVKVLVNSDSEDSDFLDDIEPISGAQVKDVE